MTRAIGKEIQVEVESKLDLCPLKEASSHQLVFHNFIATPSAIDNGVWVKANRA